MSRTKLDMTPVWAEQDMFEFAGMYWHMLMIAVCDWCRASPTIPVNIQFDLRRRIMKSLGIPFDTRDPISMRTVKLCEENILSCVKCKHLVSFLQVHLSSHYINEVQAWMQNVQPNHDVLLGLAGASHARRGWHDQGVRGMLPPGNFSKTNTFFGQKMHVWTILPLSDGCLL